jgi:diguanylate cyclase (GGDEF)-like protein/PAS domain S-box-containing protein
MNQNAENPISSEFAKPSGKLDGFHRELIELVLIAVAYWCTVRLGLLLVTPAESIAAVWPASGFTLAILLLKPKTQWAKYLIIIFVVNAAGNWSGGNSLAVSLGFALANMLEPLFCARVLIYFCGSKINFGRAIEIFSLFGVAIFVNGTTALLGAAISVLFFDASFLKAWWVWETSDGLGIILITPLIVTWVNGKNIFKSLSPQKLLESISLVAAMVIFGWLLFGPFTNANEPILRNYMIFPLLILLAFRFSPRGMSGTLTLFSIVAIWNTLQGYGIFSFADQSAFEHLTSVQLFLIVTSFSGMLLSAVVIERQHTETALRDSERQFRAIFEQMNIGVAIVDSRNGRFQRINQQYCNIIGYTEQEMLQSTFQMITHPEDLQADLDNTRALIAGEIRQFSMDKRYYHKNGNIVWVNLAVSPLWKEGETGSLLVSIAVDITERKHAEEALLESEKRYRELFEKATLAIFQSTSDDKVIMVNPAFAKMFGYESPEEVFHKIKNVSTDLFADPQRRLEIVRLRAENPGLTTFENLYRRKDGSTFPGRLYIRTIKEMNNVTSVFEGFIEDITEHKQVEEARREANAYNRRLIEASMDPLVTIGPDGKITDINKATEFATGVSRDQLIGDKFSNYFTEPEKAREGYQTALTEGFIKDYPLTIRHASGRKINVLYNASVYKNEAGRIQGVFAAAHDITELKRTEGILQTLLLMRQYADSNSLDELLKKTLDDIEALTDSQIGFLHFLEADQTTLTLQMWSTNTLQNMCTAEGKGQHYPIDLAGVWVDCVPTRAPVIYNDYASLPHRKGLPEGHALVVRFIAIPVIREDRIVMIIGVGNKEKDYDEYDVKVASELANSAWDIVQRKRAEEALFLSEEKYRTVANFTYDWETWRGPDGVYRYISPSCERVTGYSAAEFLADPNLVIKIAHPEDQIKVGEHFNVSSNESRELDLQFDFRIITASGEIRWISHFCNAVYGEDGQWLGRRENNRDITERKLAEEELQRAQQAITAVNIELQTALAREKQLAHTDELTGINNRRYLFELAEHELDIAMRYEQPLAVVMFDIDHFKGVNDTYGHNTGDRILHRVAQAACTELRSVDVIGRYGGEEFVIVLPMTNAQQAYPLAERIREGVMAMKESTDKGDVRVTLSIGIAEKKQDTQSESMDNLIRKADKAMYAAKQAGRNRTMIGL